jgi:DNA-binding LacI/PurR family transcriptional regulator
MDHSVSIRDIAAHTKVSIATVSRALTGKREVSASTRLRVLAACEKLGYRRNPLVAALMRTRRRHISPTDTLTLAFVTAFPTPDAWRRHPSPIFRQMFVGAENQAKTRNYRLEHFWLFRDGMTNARFSRMLSARGIRGLLFAPVPDIHIPVELDWQSFSTVVLGLTPSTQQFHRVATDYYQSMLLAMTECQRLGYQRPALAVRSETIKRLEYRWEGAYAAACRHFDLRTPPLPLIVDEWTNGAVDRWLARERPDVVIGPVLGKLEEMLVSSGSRIPHDLGLLGLLVPRDGDRLSGILQDGEVIGATAVDQLISALERNETGIPAHPITHTLLGRWNAGRTLRPIGIVRRSRKSPDAKPKL